MVEGWLKIYRKLTDWEWYNHSEMVHLFVHLLLKASPTDKMWQGMKVNRGQVITGRQKLSAETGISERTIRTCLSRMVESGEIEIKTTNRFSVITICKYGDYQPSETQSDQQNDQQNDQQSVQPSDHIIRNKEDKNIIPSSTLPDGSAKEGSRKNKKKPEECSIVTKGRNVFVAYYKELFDEEYYWKAKDAKAMKDLLKQLEFARKNKKPPLPVDDDSLIEALDVLLRSINSEWVLENFSVTNISSQYNNIVSSIRKSRNGKSKGNNQQDGTGQLERQMQAITDDIAKADEYYYHQQGRSGKDPA